MNRVMAGLMLMLLAGCAAMQPIPEEARNIEVIVDAPGASKDEIFTAARVWIAENFKSAKSVIEYENRSEGTIVGNGIIDYPCSGIDCVAKGDWNVPFTMRIDTKDGRMRLAFTNVNLSWPASAGRPAFDGPVRWQSDLDVIQPKLIALGPQIVAAVQRQGARKDW